MNKHVFVVQKHEFEEGCPFNDPYGPQEYITVLGVFASETSADQMCKEEAEAHTRFPSEEIKKGENSYTIEDSDGFTTWYYKKYELED